MASACLVALVFRFIWGLGSATFTPGNFFAYLTIQSNMLFVAVTVLAGVLALRGRDDAPWLDLMRAIALSTTLSCGVIFGLIVEQSGERGFRIDVPWSDIVLHFVLPVIAVLDWVIGPGRGRAPWRTITFVVTFMLGWGIVTLIRGPIVGWYPYFFLDPAQLANAGQFFFFGSVALVLFGGISAGIVGVSRVRPWGERWSEQWAERKLTTVPRRAPGRTSRLRAGRRR
jgi:hypothetical protein